jgi:ABC-type glycerol-3-phosphate transport system substrate-binding protein
VAAQKPQATAVTAPIVVATPAPEPVAPEGAAVITVRVAENDVRQFTNLAETFTADNPLIVVRVEPVVFASELAPKGSTMTRYEPDDQAASSDCFAWESGASSTLANHVLDLQPLIDADPSFDRNDYPAALLELFRYEGTLQGLPDQVGLPVLHYNRDRFDAAGLTYPSASWTPSDFLNAAQQLTGGEDETRRYGFVSAGWMPEAIMFFLDRFGAQPTRSDGTRVQPNFSDPQTLAAIRFFLDLLRYSSPHEQIEDYNQSTSAPDWAAFARTGRAAMWFNNSRYGGDAPQYFFAYAVAPRPFGDSAVTPRDFDVITGWFISAQTPYPAACWQWLRYLSAEHSRISEVGRFPARISQAESAAFLEGATPGMAEVYAAYAAIFDSSAPGSVASRYEGRISADSDQIDGYWFYQAIDRALQGADLERELADAQFLTQQYIACHSSGEGWAACARQVDPNYAGYGLSFDLAER